MSFEADLKAHLQGDADIAGIVVERIFPMVVEKGKPVPAITYTVVFGEPVNCLDGYTSGVRRINLQLDCWSLSYTALLRLAQAVFDRMNTDAASFKSVINEFPLLDDYESDTDRFRRSIGVSCWYTEP